MKRYLGFLCLYLGLMSCVDSTPKVVSTEMPLKGTEVVPDLELEVYDFEGFEAFLSKNDNKTYVINFWATWCAPCIKELPAFEAVNKKYENGDVEVILVSLDFPKQYEKKLIPFIEKRNLKSKVIALDDPKMNDWIPKIDENWSGAIPATIIYNKDRRQFYERSFSLEELETELKQFITS